MRASFVLVPNLLMFGILFFVNRIHSCWNYSDCMRIVSCGSVVPLFVHWFHYVVCGYD